MKKRVDIELEEETLKWAGIEAAKFGISRRRYISKSFTVFRLLLQTRAINLDPFNMHYTAQPKPKCSSNE
jgi:hypothetical protein